MTTQNRESLTSEDTSTPLETALTVEFETATLPTTIAKFHAFVDLMEQRLAVRLDEDIAGMIAKMDDIPRLTITELDKRIPVSIGLLDGRLEVKKGGNAQFVLIHFVQIAGGGDVIRAAMFGDSDDAEQAVARTYECIWEAAGQKKQLSDARQAIHSRGFVTSTIEQLDCSFDHIFSPGVTRFLKGIAATPDGLGVQMGVRPFDKSTGKPTEINPHVAVRLRELRFIVNVIDLDSGRGWECPLVIVPKTKTTKGKGLYNVTSELPHEGHRKLVESLRRALEEGRTVEPSQESVRVFRKTTTC